MCGIFGIVYRNGETLPSQRLLQKSAEALVHRGPDGSGIYHEPGIGLAHTRLSLLDLDARSNQPFWDAEGRHCLVYNGEIYNFREIREDLIRRGAAFRTTSDTEVLLTSLVMDGPETTLRRLRGMFAFAFYDRAKRRLTLARDRYGIKPLFIHRHREFLLFSSEVKAMRPWVQLAGNPLYLIAGLIGSTEATRHACIFEDTEILPPGTMLSIDSAGREESRHVLDLADMIDPEAARGLGAMSDRQSVDRLDELMNESVRSMMLADAPVGALCSGGVDSALLTAIATRYHSNIAIFHADVKGHSEYDAARAVAKHLKLDLQKVEAEEQHFIDLSPKAILHYEWPYVYHPHSIPFMMVADLARRSGVKAVLTGEGADECFLGYAHLLQRPFWKIVERLGGGLRRSVRSIPLIGPALWPVDERGSLVCSALKQFERKIDEDRARRLWRERMGGALDGNEMTLEQLSNYIRTLLHRNDRMGMAASIEARFPFLDDKLVETAINLPFQRKVRTSLRPSDRSHPFRRDKWILRQLADRYLPRELAHRRKRPFKVSAVNRIRVQRELFRDSFMRDFLRMSEGEFGLLFQAADQHTRVKLAMLEVWGQIFVHDRAAEDLVDPLRRHLSLATA
jgi:asparagine synthase (glutamine-hydrolysing)